MTAARVHLLFVAALLALLPACRLSRPAPDIVQWSLDPGPPPAVSAKPLPGVLLVRTFESNGLTSRPGFVTREAGGAIRRDFFNEFSEPPPVLLANLFARDLAAARAAQQVARPGSRLEQDWEIEGSVEALEVGRAVPGQPRARLALEIRLILVDHSGRKVRETIRFDASEPLADTRPATAVAAWNRLLRRALDQTFAAIGQAAR
ncbi:MAG: membrane integrity-associated transporter subunit PqiC [Verrucomicrobiae bacterium]|nr:membrane integrity-associated transporter subunit PqiC [Verrucomicrobiae bacterium]